MPKCTCLQLLLVPMWFLCILLLDERFVQVQPLQQGSRVSRVPAYHPEHNMSAGL